MKNLSFLMIFLIMSVVNAQIVPQPLDLTGYGATSRAIKVTSPTNVWTSLNGSALNLVAHSNDGGASWLIDTIPNTDEMVIGSLDALDEQHVWVTLWDPYIGGGQIWSTSDGGEIWTLQTDTQFTGVGGFLNFVHFFSADSGLAVGDPTDGFFEIYTTTDGGSSWLRVPQEDIPDPLADEYGNIEFYSFIGNNIWFSTYIGRIYHSTDAGYTWEVFTIDSSLGLMWAAFSDELNGICHQAAAALPLVYITNDGGATWTEQNLEPALDVIGLYSIKGIPGLCVFLATQDTEPLKLYVTDDNFNSYHLLDSTLDYGYFINFYDHTTGWINSEDTTNAMYKYSGNLLTETEINSPSNLSQLNLNVFPNPVTADAALISFQLEKSDKVTISLVDITGKITAEQTIDGIAGKNVQVFDFTGIAHGAYFIELKDNQSASIKVIVN